MDLNERSVGAALVVCPRGRIDHQNAGAFSDALQPHVAACGQGSSALVLDLSGVEYMSSAGLRVLMLAARELRTGKGVVVVCGLQPVMREIFEISRFHHVLDIYDTADDALAGVVAPS